LAAIIWPPFYLPLPKEGSDVKPLPIVAHRDTIIGTTFYPIQKLKDTIFNRFYKNRLLKWQTNPFSCDKFKLQGKDYVK